MNYNNGDDDDDVQEVAPILPVYKDVVMSAKGGRGLQPGKDIPTFSGDPNKDTYTALEWFEIALHTARRHQVKPLPLDNWSYETFGTFLTGTAEAWYRQDLADFGRNRSLLEFKRSFLVYFDTNYENNMFSDLTIRNQNAGESFTQFAVYLRTALRRRNITKYVEQVKKLLSTVTPALREELIRCCNGNMVLLITRCPTWEDIVVLGRSLYDLVTSDQYQPHGRGVRHTYQIQAQDRTDDAADNTRDAPIPDHTGRPAQPQRDEELRATFTEGVAAMVAAVRGALPMSSAPTTIGTGTLAAPTSTLSAQPTPMTQPMYTMPGVIGSTAPQQRQEQMMPMMASPPSPWGYYQPYGYPSSGAFIPQQRQMNVNGNRSQRGPCHNCGELGHFRNRCRRPPIESRYPYQSDAQANGLPVIRPQPTDGTNGTTDTSSSSSMAMHPPPGGPSEENNKMSMHPARNNIRAVTMVQPIIIGADRPPPSTVERQPSGM